MKSNLFSVFKYLLLFAIGIGLLWLTFRHENIHEILGKIEKANPYWLLLSLLIALAAFISRAIRWKLLIEPLGYEPKLSNTFYALMLGYFANLAIPRIGEITRCGALSGVEKVPFNSLIGTVIIERVIDLLMLFVSMFVVAILEYDMLKKFLSEKVIGPMLEKFTLLNSPLVLIVFVIFIALVLFLLYRFNKKSENERPIVTKIRGILQEVNAGFKSILKMKKSGWFVFHTILIWVLYFFLTWVCFFCLEATAHLDVKAGLFVLVVGGLGMSAPVQGGIGAYHYIVSQGLQLFGVSSTDGIVYATLVHTTQTLLVVVLGLLSMLMLFLARKKNVRNEQAGLHHQ